MYTPEFQPLVVAFSSPLPLSLSLWLLTAAHADSFSISLSILRARMGNYMRRGAGQPRAESGLRSPLVQ